MPTSKPLPQTPLTEPNPLGRWMRNEKSPQKVVYVVANSEEVTKDLHNHLLKDGWMFIADPTYEPPEPEPETPEEEEERLLAETKMAEFRLAELRALRESQAKFIGKQSTSVAKK